MKNFKLIVISILLVLFFSNSVLLSAKPGLLVFNPELLMFDGKYYIPNDFNAFCETLEKEAGYRLTKRTKDWCAFSGPYHGLDKVEFGVSRKGNNEIKGVGVFLYFSSVASWKKVKEAHEAVVAMIKEQVNTKDVVSLVIVQMTSLMR